MIQVCHNREVAQRFPRCTEGRVTTKGIRNQGCDKRRDYVLHVIADTRKMQKYVLLRVLIAMPSTCGQFPRSKACRSKFIRAGLTRARTIMAWHAGTNGSRCCPPWAHPKIVTRASKDLEPREMVLNKWSKVPLRGKASRWWEFSRPSQNSDCSSLTGRIGNYLDGTSGSDSRQQA
jgi:hypothetical protein